MIIKAYIYLTRKKQNSQEILVFTQAGHPAAGIQIPGGTVDKNEEPLAAIRRELKEESGLDISQIYELGACDFFHIGKKEMHHRHFFTADTTDLPEEWSHAVSSGEDDKGLVFEYFWMPAKEASRSLAGEQGRLISRLENEFPALAHTRSAP
jgi:8-oxo-dGTP pyrophosphatase MutT (NUDIX family)